MKESVWFVILTYHPEKEKLLKHLEYFKGFSYLLVDNSETANEYAKDISVVRTKKNLGYAGGMNRGIRYCLDQGAAWIVVINDDLMLTKKSLHKLTDTLQEVAPGIAGPFSGALENHRWTTMYPSKKRSQYISGSCFAIHRNVIDKIGIFYEPYFIYYEDVEYCIRTQKMGLSLTPLQISEVHHEDGSTFRKKSFLHEYYLARNHLLFVERNAPVRVKIHELARLPKTVWEHWKRGEAGALVGIRDYFLRRFGQYTPL